MSVQVPKALSRMCMFQWSMFYWPLPRRVWPHCTCGVEMHSSPLALREARLMVQRHSASMANPSAHLLGPSPAAVNLSWGTRHTAAHSEGTKGPGGASTLLNCSLWYGSPQYSVPKAFCLYWVSGTLRLLPQTSKPHWLKSGAVQQPAMAPSLANSIQLPFNANNCISGACRSSKQLMGSTVSHQPCVLLLHLEALFLTIRTKPLPSGISPSLTKLCYSVTTPSYILAISFRSSRQEKPFIIYMELSLLHSFEWLFQLSLIIY